MNVHDLYERRNEFFLKPSATFRGALGFFTVVGILAVVAGAFSGISPERIWGSVLLSVFFFFSVALGGIAFSGMQDVIGAVWARPIKRVHEAFAAFLPVSGAILAIFIICFMFDLLHARDVYVWMTDPHMLDHFHGKNVWLNITFLGTRDLVALAIILGLSFWQLRQSARRDRAFCEGHRDEAMKLAEQARDSLRYWSAPILVVYALCYSLLCFDLLMSLAPIWFSTLWAGWLFAIMMQTLMATILLFLFALRDTPLGEVYKRQQFHDVGKLMHGFTIFFAYLTYAHVLTYWYGNVPEETEYFIHRLHAPWLYIVLAAPILNFIIPLFVLLLKAAKWTSAITIPLSLIILVSQWFVYVLVVAPEINGGHMGFSQLFVDVGVLLGVVGLFLMSIYSFGKRYPMLGIADALLPQALDDQHH